jgi:hypothetical protein
MKLSLSRDQSTSAATRKPMRSTTLTLALVACASIAASAQGAVHWSVTVGAPVPTAYVYAQQPVQATLQAQPYATVSAPAPVAAQTVPPTITIEEMQAQQQARIQWGVQVGLITAHEYNRLQQTQQYIEEQRRWAYADGWLTYDEHVHLINLLNGASQEIENKLANWQRVQNTVYPMPAVLSYWAAPRYEYYGYEYPYNHRGHGVHGGHHGQQTQQHQHQGKPARIVIPLPPLPPSPHKVLKNLREHLDGSRY